LRAKDYGSLLSYADFISKQTYSSASKHFEANQLALLIKKFPWGARIPGLDPEANALKKFHHAEHLCRRVNQRFSLYDGLRSPHEEYLASMRHFISYVLGTFEIGNVIAECGFGPGASIGVGGDATSLADKLLSPVWTVSPSALCYSAHAYNRNPQLRELAAMIRKESYAVCYDTECCDNVEESQNSSWFEHRVEIATYNKVAFVPKTALVHRTIAIEPLWNGYLQKGTDLFMRKRLKRIGIDLSDQSLNQKLAREGSFDSNDPFVTIDLSSASDSIATSVVKNLVHPEWFAYLNDVRSRNYLMQGVVTPYNKFVSMGNGFCFPLETLIFVAACHAVKCGKPGIDFSVYGDDIIVRQSKAIDLLRLLKVLGFRANTDKTFLEGPFRESCGADWFGGEDVRPFTLDYELDSVQNIFKFLNLSQRNKLSRAYFCEVRPVIFNRLPSDICFCRPFTGNADTAIEVEMDHFMTTPSALWVKSLRAWSWHEIDSLSVPSDGTLNRDGYSVTLVIAALTGAASHMPFSLRRKTKARIVRKCGSGASSNWLPALRYQTPW